jgi:2-desacetyl-2-hydroxyethyl bacteriochlorophyllide A dehydrogenase
MKSKGLWFLSPRKIEFVEEEVGNPQGNKVMIESLYSGVSSGTEMLIYRGEAPPNLELDPTLTTMKGSFRFPIKYGYSNVGRVIETGLQVSNLHQGDIIFAHHPHQTRYIISQDLVIKIPSDIPPLQGIFIANLETALNCLLDCDIKLGESVVVFGQGIIGLLITQLVRKTGAGKIITVDRIERRQILSQELGANFTLNPDKDNVPVAIRELTDGVGADVIIEASGSPNALNSAIKSAAFQGLVVVMSWYGTKPVTLYLGDEFHRNRIRVKSSQVSHLDPTLTPRWSIKRRMSTVLNLLPQVNWRELISDIYLFEEAQVAYEKIDKKP